MELNSPDAFHVMCDHLLAKAGNGDPWTSPSEFSPDFDLLAQLASVPLRQGKSTQSGLRAKALDYWVASELRRAGFGPDEVWPRGVQPRVLPQPLVELEQTLRGEDRAALRKLVRGSADARILGAYYDKQVDVVIADWDRGLELMVSTRSMSSSYKNNLHNRSEDIVGDADNLRGRYPLASIGLLFVVRDNIENEAGAMEFVADTLSRVRNQGLYDAAGLVVFGWDDGGYGDWTGEVEAEELEQYAAATPVVRVRPELTPDEVSCSRFFVDLVARLLERTPVTYHENVRRRRSGRAPAGDDA